jgi:hypothetical protein
MCVMNSREIHGRARVFLADAVAQLKRLPPATICAWPAFPPSPNFDLKVPQELRDAKCVFTVMKYTFPSGDIEIAVQYFRRRYLHPGTRNRNSTRSWIARSNAAAPRWEASSPSKARRSHCAELSLLIAFESEGSRSDAVDTEMSGR